MADNSTTTFRRILGFFRPTRMLLVSLFIVAVGFTIVRGALLADFFDRNPYMFYLITSVLGIIFGIAGYTTGRDPPELDVTDRLVSERIEQSERRLTREVQRQTEQALNASLKAGTRDAETAISSAIEERLNAGLIKSIDAALAQRTKTAAMEMRRWQRVSDVFERIRIKLDGPASRAETAARNFRLMAALFAFFGVVVSVVRVFIFRFGLSKEAIDAANATSSSLLTVAAINAAPWVGLVLLVEFTALLYYRFYARSVELQRYFTKELAGVEVRLAAMNVILETGTKDQIVAAAKVLMNLEPNMMAPEAPDLTAARASKIVEKTAAVAKSLKLGAVK